ncbi:MAG: hypothetical protein IT165_23575 [Bryobacterales bacterium]|nr:hypothetical protein [Bryobacterales bacterium]
MAIRTPLNIEAVNLDNERELDAFHEAWIDSCEDKFQQDFRKLRELGIVDAEGRQLKAVVPEDMLDAQAEFGG